MGHLNLSTALLRLFPDNKHEVTTSTYCWSHSRRNFRALLPPLLKKSSLHRLLLARPWHPWDVCGLDGEYELIPMRLHNSHILNKFEGRSGLSWSIQGIWRPQVFEDPFTLCLLLLEKCLQYQRKIGCKLCTDLYQVRNGVRNSYTPYSLKTNLADWLRFWYMPFVKGFLLV